MKEVVRKPIEGFEDNYESLVEKKNNLDSEKQKAVEEAIAKVEESFSEREGLIKKLLDMVTVEVEVEVEDPVEEVVEEAPVEEEVVEELVAEETVEANTVEEEPIQETASPYQQTQRPTTSRIFL